MVSIQSDDDENSLQQVTQFVSIHNIRYKIGNVTDVGTKILNLSHLYESCEFH